MANKSGIALGEAVASGSAFPGALDDYRARFTDHWAPYGKALQSFSSPLDIWRPGPYPSVVPQLSNWQGLTPALEHQPLPLAEQGWRASNSPPFELPAQIVHAYPQPRPRADSTPRINADAPEARQGVVSGEGEAVSSASADPTPSRATARTRAGAAAREAASATKLDLGLKLFHTASTATTPKEQAVGYLSAVGSAVGTLGGKALGAAVPRWGTMVSEVGGVAFGMAGDKLGAWAGERVTNPASETAKDKPPSTPVSTQSKPDADPYSTLSGSVKDALTTAAVVGGGYASWEVLKRRYTNPGAVAGTAKGVAENLKALKIPLASMFIEAGAKAAYTYGTAQTREERWSGYGGAAGGLILGGALGAAGSLLGPIGTTIGMSVGNFVGDQVGSAVGKYLATQYPEPASTEQPVRRGLPAKASGTAKEQSPERARSSGPPSPLRPPGLMAQFATAASVSSQRRPTMLTMPKPGSTADTAGMDKALVRDLLRPPVDEGRAASVVAKQRVAGAIAEPRAWPPAIPGLSLVPGIVPSPRFESHGASVAPAAVKVELPRSPQKPSRPAAVLGLPKVAVQASASGRSAVMDKPAVEVQVPAAQLSVPPQASVLPDAPPQAPAQPVITGGAGQPFNFTTNIPITLQGAAVAHDQLATDLELAVRRVLEERQRADEARLADPLRQF
ncbi:hypothetical protein [Pseudomonas sp. A014]|uniref:hypothetical protein n=1 Tax=Pseudomonas sp. A014 TaxID=3458058 RepID=UPI004036CBD2